MGLVVPPGFAQVLIPHQHSSLARAALVTFAVDVSAAGGDFAQVADDIALIWEEAWAATLDNNVQIGPVTLRVGQDGGDPLAVEGSTTAFGTESSSMSPPNIALLVKKQTALGGRKGRGRFYIPWVVQEGATSEVGVLDGGSLTARQTAANTLQLELQVPDTGTYATPMVLLHDSEAAGSLPPPTLVTALVVDPLIATQRRRLGR